MIDTRWLWLTIPVTAICLIVVPLLAWRLYQGQRDSVLVSVPLAAQQDIDIKHRGAMLLHAQGPRLTRAFADAEFGLTNLSDHRDVPLTMVLFRQASSGLKQARLSLRSFEIAVPGRYRLTVTGHGLQAATAAHAMVITLDQRSTLFLRIVMLVFASIGFLAGLVLSLIIYLGNR